MQESWLLEAIFVAVLAVLTWVMQRALSRSEKKIDSIGEKVEKQGGTLTEIRLGVTQCVTWNDLGKELGPMKTELKQQDHRLTVMEIHCKSKESKG